MCLRPQSKAEATLSKGTKSPCLSPGLPRVKRLLGQWGEHWPWSQMFLDWTPDPATEARVGLSVPLFAHL